MLNKYKIHILTTLNKRPTGIHTDFKENIVTKQRLNNEHDFICQSIDNLKQTIESLLGNNIFRQFKPCNKIQNDRFQWLLNYINQLLVTYRDRYCNHETSVSNIMSELYLTTNNSQQQTASNLIKDSKLIIDRSCDDGKDLGVYTQNRISSFECIKKKISYPIKTKSIEYILKQMILAELQQIFTIECDDSLERAYFERKMIFLTKELILLNHKDINNNWKNINKQRIQLILTISNTINRLEKLKLSIYQDLINQFNKHQGLAISIQTISYDYKIILQSESVINIFIRQYLIHRKKLLEQRLVGYNKQTNLFKSAIDIIQQIKDENKPSVHLYILIEQFIKILREFGHYEHKANLLICHRFFSDNGILQNILRIPAAELLNKSIFNYLQDKHDTQHLQKHIDNYERKILRFFPTKVNPPKLKYQIQEVRTSNSSSSLHALKKKSIVNTSSTMFSSFQSNSSPISIRTFCGQTYDRSTSAHTSKKRSHRHYPSFTTRKDEIDQSTPANILSRVAEKLDDNEIKRDYFIPPKTIKCQNDYIDKSSKSKHYSTQNNPSNLSDIYIKLSDCQAACRRWATKQEKTNLFSSPYRTRKHSHRKTKIPICYRNFPLSLNALSKYGNDPKRYINRCDVNFRQDIQTNISVDIRKMSCKKIHDSFICFGTSNLDFIDGPNGPILCLKQEDSETDEQICLYRRMSNDELNFRDDSGDQQVTNSFVSIENDESNLESDFKQSLNLTLSSAHLLREEKTDGTLIQLETSLLGELVTCTRYQSPLEATVVLDIIPACILILPNRLSTMSTIQLASLSSKILEVDSASLWQHKSSLNIRLVDDIRTVQDQQEPVPGGNDRDPSKTSNEFTDFVPEKNLNKVVENMDHMEESDQDDSDNEQLLHSHELDPSKTRTTDDQGEQHAQLIVDYDQTSNKRNLIDNEQPNDKGSNPDLNSNTAPISYLPMDQYFEIASTVDGTDKQETILYSKSSKISLFSDNINHPSLSDNQDQSEPKENVSDSDETPSSSVKLSTGTSSLIKEDQLLDKTPDRFDNDTLASLLTELPHSLKSNETLEGVNDLSVTSLQSPVTTDTIYSTMPSQYNVDIQSISITNRDPWIEEVAVKGFKEKKQQTLDDPSVTTPTSVGLRVSSERLISQHSDPLLPTAVIPKHSSTSLDTKVSLSYDKNLTFSQEHIPQVPDDEQEVSHPDNLGVSDDTSPINDVYHTEKITLERAGSLSRTRSSSLQYPPLISTPLSNRKISCDSFRHLSEPTSLETNTHIRRKHSNEKLQTSRIMTISPKAIHNIIGDKDLNSLKKQKRHYIMNQMSDLQSKIHNIHADKPTIGLSSSILANSTARKEKNKLSVIPRKRIRKNRLSIRPPWVSSYENPTRNSYHANKPIKRTSLPLKQQNDPCQVLELYTQLKRIHCKPYDCVCTPLVSCSDLSSPSFMKHAHICNMYLMQNDKI